MKRILWLLLLAGCTLGRDADQERAIETARSASLERVLGGPPPDPAREEALAKAPTLALVQEAAVARNPDLLAALERWSSFLERAPEKWAPANPMLAYSYNSMFKMHQVGTVLVVPFPTKMKYEADAALAEARAAGADYRERANALRAEAAIAYANLWLAERQLAIVDKNLELLGRFVEIVEGKFKAGAATLPDTLRAQVERDGLRADRAALAGEAEIARSALNVLLDREPAAPLGPLAPLASPEEEAPARSLVEEALEKRPALAAAAERANAADLMVARAEQEWLPDLQAGGSYIRDFGTERNFVQLEGGVSLPIFFGPIRARVRQAEADARSSRAELRATRNRVLDEARAAELRVAIERNRWKILTKDALPRVESAIAASEAAYVAQKIELLLLIDTQRQLLEKELERERAVAGYAIAKAQLERALGR